MQGIVGYVGDSGPYSKNEGNGGGEKWGDSRVPRGSSRAEWLGSIESGARVRGFKSYVDHFLPT